MAGKNQIWMEKAKIEDIQRVFQLVEEAYSGYIGSSGFGFKRIGRYREFSDLQQDLQHYHVLKESTNQIVGCIRVLHEVDHVWVGPLAVDQSKKGLGYGSFMMDWAETLGPIVRLKVISAHTHLQKWYSGRGYTVARRYPITDDVPTHLLHRPELEMIIFQKMSVTSG